jgi:chromosome segregation ATPase
LQKRHQDELAAKEEKLVKQQLELQRQLDSMRSEHESVVQKLRRAAESAASTTPVSSPGRPSHGQPNDAEKELVRLHQAHNAKLNAMSSKVQKLEEENARLKRETEAGPTVPDQGADEEEFKYE